MNLLDKNISKGCILGKKGEKKVKKKKKKKTIQQYEVYCVGFNYRDAFIG